VIEDVQVGERDVRVATHSRSPATIVGDAAPCVAIWMSSVTPMMASSEPVLFARLRASGLAQREVADGPLRPVSISAITGTGPTAASRACRS